MTPLDKLYDYQKEAITPTFYNPRGIICLPTGTGKSYCQAAQIASDIQNNQNQFRMYVINAPRILLTYQLLKDVFSFLIDLNIHARYMFVHSGGSTNMRELDELRIQANVDGANIPFSEIPSGTNSETISDMMRKAKEDDTPLIFFSTYNSTNLIEYARSKFTKQPISLVLNDEAHYLVQEQFHDSINTLYNSKMFFYTATMLYTPSENGRGMNNTETYGNVLYEMKPIEAIQRGKMVRPRLHIVKSENVYKSDDYDRSAPRIILEAFYQHEEVIGHSAKILVSVKGVRNIKRFLESREYLQLRQDNVDICCIASDKDIGNDINGEKYTRQNFLKFIKDRENDIERKMIVVHYDTMAEGISVNGFTGILPLRNLNKAKFLQTFGRAARLNPIDRKNLEDGIIGFEDTGRMIKPYAYVIIPNVVQTNEDSKENFIDLINELRQYGFKPWEDIVSTERVSGMVKKDELETVALFKSKLPNIGELISNLEADIEDERNAKLARDGFIGKVENLF